MLWQIEGNRFRFPLQQQTAQLLLIIFHVSNNIMNDEICCVLTGSVEHKGQFMLIGD